VSKISRTTASLTTGLMMSAGVGRNKIEYPGLDHSPFAFDEVERTFQLLTSGETPIDECARLFDVLRRDESGHTASDVLQRMEVLIAENAMGDIRDFTSGIWIAAAAVVLSLPEPVLQKMFLTSEMARRLADMKPLVLGQLWNLGSRGGMHPEYRKLVEGKETTAPEELIAVMHRLAIEMRTKGPPNAGSLASSFDRALDVLSRNALRLEHFTTLPEAADPAHAGKQLAELVDRFVPCVSSAGLLQFEAAAEALPADSDDELPVTEPTQPNHSPRALQRPTTIETKDEVRSVVEQAPAVARAVNMHVRPALHPQAQPGAQIKDPGLHWHAAEHEGLKKRDAKAGKAKHLRVVKGLLHPRAVYTPQMHAELVEVEREERLLRNLGTRHVVGQRLVAPLSLT
jgi:hypothetical protein